MHWVHNTQGTPLTRKNYSTLDVQRHCKSRQFSFGGRWDWILHNRLSCKSTIPNHTNDSIIALHPWASKVNTGHLFAHFSLSSSTFFTMTATRTMELMSWVKFQIKILNTIVPYHIPHFDAEYLICFLLRFQHNYWEIIKLYFFLLSTH